MNSKRAFAQTIILSFAAVITLSFSTVHAPRAFADANSVCSTVANSQAQGAVCLPTDPTGVTGSIPAQNLSVSGAIIGIIQIMLAFSFIIAIFFVVIGGYRYIFDGGNDEQATKGRKTVINALIGIVVILLSYVIVTSVSYSITHLNSSPSTTTTSQPVTTPEHSCVEDPTPPCNPGL